MSTRQTIVAEMADMFWCISWSDHVEDHGCYNLSGCAIEDHAPPQPKEALPLAEKCLACAETRLALHDPLSTAVTDAIVWLDAHTDHSVNEIIAECHASPICAALLVAARADAVASVKGKFTNLSDTDKIAIAVGSTINMYEDETYVKRFAQCLAYDLVGAGVAWSDDHVEIPWPSMLDQSATDELGCIADKCGAFKLANLERFECSLRGWRIVCERTLARWRYVGPAHCGPKEVRQAGHIREWQGPVSASFVATLLRKLRDPAFNIQRIELTPRRK